MKRKGRAPELGLLASLDRLPPDGGGQRTSGQLPEPVRMDAVTGLEVRRRPDHRHIRRHRAGAPGLMSWTMAVPPAVPSLDQSSLPEAAVTALK